MKVFKTPALKYLFFLELILLLSIIVSVLIFLIYHFFPGDAPPGIDFPHSAVRGVTGYRYPVFKQLLAITPVPAEDEPVADSGFIRAWEQLDEIQRLMVNQGGINVYQLITRIPRDFALIRQKREYLYYRWLYQNRRYDEFVRGFEQVEIHKEEMGILALNCLLKTNQPAQAVTRFKDTILTTGIPDLIRLTTPADLGYLLGHLDEKYWARNLHGFLDHTRFGDFTRIRKLLGDRELGFLMQAFYRYRQGDYRKTRVNLEMVQKTSYLSYKHALLAKMAIREDIDAGISDHIKVVSGNKPAYQRLLLNLGKLYFLHGRPGRSMVCLEDLMEQIRDDRSPGDPFYHELVWMNIGNHFRQGVDRDRSAMLSLLSVGKEAPQLSIRSACEYWYDRISGRKTAILSYPYNYYSLISGRPWRDLYFSGVMAFLDQIRDMRDDDFLGRLVEETRILLERGRIDEMVNLLEGEIRYSEVLGLAEKRFLRLVLAVALTRTENFGLAFKKYVSGVEDLQRLVPPRFLKDFFFPLKYRNLIREYANRYRVDPAIVCSIIREESFYNPGARSYAGALGLMQLMEGTARRMLEPGEGKISPRDLYRPELNIKLGCRYLRFLLDRYRGNLVLTLAAYNAGTTYVDQWLSFFEDHPRDEFIEAIPIEATRAYVKKIFRDYFFYRFYYNDQRG